MRLGLGLGIGISHPLMQGWGGWWSSAYGSDVGLALDFANNRAYNAAGADKNLGIASLLTIVRASAGSYFDSSGTLQQAANNALRLDYDPVTLAPLGVLVEEQRTNLLLRSQEFDNAAWTKGGATVSANAAVAPDGTSTADKLVETAATSAHSLYRSTTLTAAAYTTSYYLKAAERTWAYVRLAVVAGQGAYFDLANGVIGTVEAGITARMQNCGNGWYRCSVTVTATAVTWYSSAETATGDGVAGHAGDITKGIYLWGAQLELGEFATSYIPTVASQVTRAADQISIATSAFGYVAAAGTVLVRGKTASGSGTQVLAQLGDGTSNERIRIERNSSNEIHCIITDGGVAQCDLNLGTAANSTAFKVALAWTANDFAASLNGAAVVADAAGALPTVTTLYIGADHAGSYWGGTEAADAYWPTRKPNAYLQQVTA